MSREDSARKKTGKKTGLGICLAGVLVVLCGGSLPPPGEQAQFLESLRQQALGSGISAQTFGRALGVFKPDGRVLRQARNQLELSVPFRTYVGRFVSRERVREGREMLRRHEAMLARLEARYGVDRGFLVALWGIESHYGRRQGHYSVPRALVTLALGVPRRREFAIKELLAVLRILQKGEASLAQMKGSWAGAMGQTQFIPSTFEAYAVDADGDGRRDVWGSAEDALGSAAHYLRKMGWRPGDPWGFQVRLPRGFNYTLSQGGLRSRAFWVRHGVVLHDGTPLVKAPHRVEALFLPAGHRGPAFLVGHNFFVLRRYNNSNTYSLTVALLAGQVKSHGGFRVFFPTERWPLSREEHYHLQRLLAAEGFYVGVRDGLVGAQTRQALRDWQASREMPVDGYPSRRVLNRLIREQPPVRDVEALVPRPPPPLRWTRLIPRRPLQSPLAHEQEQGEP